MATEPQGIKAPKLLVGEGIDEQRFFSALLAELKISDVQVLECGGKTALTDYLRAIEQVPAFRETVQSIGVTRDANGDPAGALQSVQDALRNAGLSGAGPSAARLRASVFILPGPGLPGMLEDLCLAALKDDPALGCLEPLFKCVRTKAKREPAPLAKAKIHAWLACQEKPDRRLGEAAQAGLVPWSHSAFEPLKQFLRGL